MENGVGQLEDHFSQKVLISFFHADVSSSFDSVSSCLNQICGQLTGQIASEERFTNELDMFSISEFVKNVGSELNIRGSYLGE